MKTARNGSRRSLWRGLAADLGAALRFSSRLPIPPLPGEAAPHGTPDVQRMARMLPVAGAIVGAVGGAVLAVALALRFGPWLAAALAVAALTLVTGAFHEDGLADTADGFGGGATPERRLAIMRDSRIGSFGATALILAFALRTAAVATIAARLDAPGAVAGLVLAAAASRAVQLGPLALLPPARRDGASMAFGRPSPGALATSGLVAAGLAAILAWATALPGWGVVLGFILAAGVALGMTRLSDRLIGGQTGDVAGAVQQLAEIAVLLGLLTALRP